MRKGSWLNHPDVEKLRTLYCGDPPLEDFTIHDKALIKCENCGTPAMKSIHLWLRGVHRHACCRRFNRVNPKDATTIKCLTCGEVKSVDDFQVTRLPTGPSYRTECKQCRSVKRNARWQAERNADPRGAWLKVVMYQTKYRAEKKGVPHNITEQDLIKCMTDNCPFCGKRMKYNQLRGDLSDSVSIDRLIPTQGYVVGNIILLCYRCNEIKRDATLAEIEMVAAGLRKVLKERGLIAEDLPPADARSTV